MIKKIGMNVLKFMIGAFLMLCFCGVIMIGVLNEEIFVIILLSIAACCLSIAAWTVGDTVIIFLRKRRR